MPPPIKPPDPNKPDQPGPPPDPPASPSPGTPSRQDRVQEQILAVLQELLQRAKSEGKSVLTHFDPRPSLATSGRVLFDALPEGPQRMLLGLRGTFEPLVQGLENLVRLMAGPMKEGFGKEVMGWMQAFSSGATPVAWSREAGHLATSLGEAIGAEAPGLGGAAVGAIGGGETVAHLLTPGAVGGAVMAAGGPAAAGAGSALSGGAAALASNPVGWVVATVAAVVAVGIAFLALPSALSSFTESLLENNRKFAESSSLMAAVMAEADVQRFYREMEIGDRTAATAKRLADAQAHLADSTKELTIFWMNLQNVIGTLLANIGSFAINYPNPGSTIFSGIPGGSALWEMFSTLLGGKDKDNNPFTMSIAKLVEAANKYLEGDPANVQPVDKWLDDVQKYHSSRRP